MLRLIGAVLLMTAAAAAQPAGRAAAAEDAMTIRIVIDGADLPATLDDNAASRDFAALLPLELTLTDYNGTEKVADLPSRLSTEGLPAGIDPEVGDITYYAPWGNLALFYRDFGYARGLVRLGRIARGVDRLTGGGALRVRIERTGPPSR